MSTKPEDTTNAKDESAKTNDSKKDEKSSFTKDELKIFGWKCGAAGACAGIVVGFAAGAWAGSRNGN